MWLLPPKISGATPRAPRGVPAGLDRYAAKRWPSAAVSSMNSPMCPPRLHRALHAEPLDRRGLGSVGLLRPRGVVGGAHVDHRLVEAVEDLLHLRLVHRLVERVLQGPDDRRVHALRAA